MIHKQKLSRIVLIFLLTLIGSQSGIYGAELRIKREVLPSEVTSTLPMKVDCFELKTIKEQVNRIGNLTVLEAFFAQSPLNIQESFARDFYGRNDDTIRFLNNASMLGAWNTLRVISNNDGSSKDLELVFLMQEKDLNTSALELFAIQQSLPGKRFPARYNAEGILFGELALISHYTGDYGFVIIDSQEKGNLNDFERIFTKRVNGTIDKLSSYSGPDINFGYFFNKDIITRKYINPFNANGTMATVTEKGFFPAGPIEIAKRFMLSGFQESTAAERANGFFIHAIVKGTRTTGVFVDDISRKGIHRVKPPISSEKEVLFKSNTTFRIIDLKFGIISSNNTAPATTQFKDEAGTMPIQLPIIQPSTATANFNTVIVTLEEVIP